MQNAECRMQNAEWDPEARNISLHGESFDITLSAMTTFYSFVKRSTTESVFGMLT